MAKSKIARAGGGRITPCLWFDRNAEEAARFYVSIFKKSRIGRISRYGEGAPLPKGTVLTVDFTLDGQEFIGLNGGPIYQFTEAVSFMVTCSDQKEIDYYWDRLVDGGKPIQCGWLQDRFGLSWQVMPAELAEMMRAKDPAKISRMMQALLRMVKLDLARLQSAFRGP